MENVIKQLNSLKVFWIKLRNFYEFCIEMLIAFVCIAIELSIYFVLAGFCFLAIGGICAIIFHSNVITWIGICLITLGIVFFGGAKLILGLF